LVNFASCLVQTFRKHIVNFLITALLLLAGVPAFSQTAAPQPQYVDSIKVHFLYGSRPYTKYKKDERKWFGGVLGGHVGIETDSGHILNFRMNGNFHLFTNNNKKHSRFDDLDYTDFYSIFGSDPDSIKRAIVTIPVTRLQKEKLDSINAQYLKECPYDYALIGMRCSAAAYEILGQLGIMKNYSHRKTYWKIFYPMKLRRRVLDKAGENNWSIDRQEGTLKRKWEKH
jgi:hypothetical protein